MGQPNRLATLQFLRPMQAPTEFFNRFPFLTEADKVALYEISVERSYAPGEVFIQLGTKRKKIGIVIEGLMRGYSIKSSGEEVSIIFAKEGEVVSTHDLIFYDMATTQTVEALEPTKMLVFEYSAIERLSEKYPGIAQLQQAFIQDFLVKVLRRLETFLVNTPEERYQWLMDQEPTLLQRVQQRHLASFLGITPVSLSRLRARMSKR